MDNSTYTVTEFNDGWCISEKIGIVCSGEPLYAPRSIPFDTEKEARDALFLDRTGDTWKSR